MFVVLMRGLSPWLTPGISISVISQLYEKTNQVKLVSNKSDPKMKDRTGHERRKNAGLLAVPEAD